MNTSYFTEVDFSQKYKKGNKVGGDTFLSQKIKAEERTISVLSDGLGSGIKANVLSTLTASMAVRYTASLRNIKKTAEIIMSTLPVCKKRKISYSTFSIADIDRNTATIIEYENPSYILIRDGEVCRVPKTEICGNVSPDREYKLMYSTFEILYGDRLVVFSDGVTQAGMGLGALPFGWGWKIETIEKFIESVIKNHPDISAGDLSEKIVDQAYLFDHKEAKDDISCGVIYFREPRETLLVSGPPLDKMKDSSLGEIVKNFNGSKIIAGGTTAKIVSRELGQELKLDMKTFDPDVPPPSKMDGADLVTEGIITLGKAYEILEEKRDFGKLRDNAAKKLADKLLRSDKITIYLGTKINEAHQDPSVPHELGIRRNIVQKIVKILEDKYLKEVHLKFI